MPPSPFTKFRQAASRVPWGAFANVVAENLHARTESASQVIDQLKQWGTHLTANALLKWSVFAATATPCGSPDVSTGRPRPCTSFAVGHCDVCGRPCCLAHARIDYQADMICEVCIGTAKAEARGGHAAPPPPRQKSERSEKASERKKAKTERAEALHTLRLDETASWEKIKLRYKKLVVKYNADRPQSIEERERNTEKLKKINAAYETLRKFQEAEAA